jgi:hypothetical protein
MNPFLVWTKWDSSAAPFFSAEYPAPLLFNVAEIRDPTPERSRRRVFAGIENVRFSQVLEYQVLPSFRAANLTDS